MAGVPLLDIMGVGGRSESVADNAGDGIITACGPEGIAIRGEGATMDEDGDTAVAVDVFTGDWGVFISKEDEVSGGAMSTFTDSSLPFSTTMRFGSGGSGIDTPDRSS